MAKPGKKTKVVQLFNSPLSVPEPQPKAEKNKKALSKEPDQSVADRKAELRQKEDILERRYLERLKKENVPKVDAGFKEKDLSEESLKRFYYNARVQEFVKPLSGGKYIKFEFGKMLDGYAIDTNDRDENDIIRKLSKAEISKKSFINNINLTVRYINYFITYFDDDDELMAAYLQFMTQLHLIKVDMPVETFVDSIYSTIATPSMIQKVIRMVEYNTDESLIKKSDRQYDESIQLTVEHLKAIMGISCFHKFIIPIVSHYYTVRKKEVEEAGLTDKDLYFQVFQTFIPLFDDHYDIQLYEKLYHTATTRISKTENQENTMWKRRERFGTTPTSFTNELMRGFLNDLSQKVVFNMSAIIFLHVCFDRAIRNELIQPDKYEMSDMPMDASDSVNETISRFDRWQMDKTQYSEQVRLRAYASTRDMIHRCGLDVGLDFYLRDCDAKYPGEVSPNKDVQAEFDFYNTHMAKPLNNTQLYLLQLYCLKALGAANDFDMMSIDDLIKVIMIMKRDLRKRNYGYLPFFISGKLQPAGSRAYNKKKTEKIFTSNPMYEDFTDQFEDTLDLLNMDNFYGELKTCLSCPIEVVEYEDQNDGRIMHPVDIAVADEWRRFMCEL